MPPIRARQRKTADPQAKAEQTARVLAWITDLVASVPAPDADGRVPLQTVVSGALDFLIRTSARGNALDRRVAMALEDYVKELRAHGPFLCGLSEFLHFIRERIQSLRVARERTRPGHLYVCSLSQCGYAGRQHTFIVGLEEGRVFPSSTEDAVLLDDERKSLSADLRLSTDRIDEAVYVFLNRFASAQGSATFSYSCRDTREFRETVEPLECSIPTQDAAAESRAAAHAVVSQPSWAVTSVTAEARHIARIARSVDALADDPFKVVAADTASHRADAGQAWGSLIHGLLEHAMRHKQVNFADLRRMGMWLTVEEPELRDVLDLAVNTVLQVAKADFWSEVKKSVHSVETPFAYAQDCNAILTGVIDLLFGHEDRWRIIDYKTDVSSTDLVASYQGQLKMYERALASVGIEDVTSAIQPIRGSGG